MNTPSPEELQPVQTSTVSSMAERYPKYHKDTRGMTSVDVYAVHMLFDLQDPSGCLHHASKKLLLSGVRTGGKSKVEDIKEARDTLTRWLELNKVVEPVSAEDTLPRSPVDLALRADMLALALRVKQEAGMDVVKDVIQACAGVREVNNIPVKRYLEVTTALRKELDVRLRK